ncbi:hypothetical protein N0V90_009540 [Kalmusia sp. IMI 367209]|nr:hypothetical protein N0V90_009540 [Kalmusia sp. IMI 367209]
MGILKELPATLEEVDIIIVGGGTAGCIVAARLADADPNLEILVVERGPNNEIPTVETPAAFFSHLAPDSKTAFFNVSKPSPDVGDRALVVPSAAILGGGSSINFMMYSRAQRCDFDAWKTPGWSADDLLPYIKKSETYHSHYVRGHNGPIHISQRSSDDVLKEAEYSAAAERLAEKYSQTYTTSDLKDVHGHNGPIHVSRGTYSSPKLQAEYIAAAEKMGWKEVPDKSDLESVNAVWRAQRFISKDGKRQDTASCYLHPRLRDGKHVNLHVLVETQVSRVLFDEKSERAIGIEFRRNPIFEADSTSKPLRSIRARKLVVLSCGTCATPPLLERSGVGDAQVLERAGVPVVIDLPGVGNEYEDHHLLSYGYKSSFAANETADALLYGRMGDMGELMKNKHKILGWNAQEVQGKFRPTETEVDALGPDFRKAWDFEFKNQPEKPVVVLSLIAGYPADPAYATGDPCIGVTAFTVYPFSRGSIHITGPTLDSPIDFETGYFAGPTGRLDIKKHIWAYKTQRSAIRLMPSHRGEAAGSTHPSRPRPPPPAFSLTAPLPADEQDIVYSADDDAVLEKWIRESVGTTWHSLGTCKMRAREDRGVVDRALGVHGIKGLKVADLSIAPGNVGANTNATALMIGEKAAHIFIEELGLGGK